MNTLRPSTLNVCYIEDHWRAKMYQSKEGGTAYRCKRELNGRIRYKYLTMNLIVRNINER
jgi:hypothetical protein